MPLQVIHAQAMNQQQDLARELGRWRPCLPVQRFATVTQSHWRGQRIVAGGEAITHHAIECREHSFALGCSGPGVARRFEQGLQPGQHGVHTLTQQARNPPNALVSQTGDAAGLSRCFAARRAQGPPDRLVDPFRDAGHARGGLSRQLGNGPNVRKAQVFRLGLECRFSHAFGAPDEKSQRSSQLWGRHPARV